MTEPAAGEQPKPRSIAKCCLGALGRICFSRVLHGCAHWGWRLLKLAAIILFFVWAVGIPGNWLSRELDPHTKPYTFTAGRIIWSPLQGFIIHNFQGFETNLFGNAVVRIDTCVIRPSYRKLIRGEWLNRHIDIIGGSAIFPLAQTTSTNQSGNIGFYRIQGRIQFTDAETLTDLTATSDLGVEFRIKGTILKSTDAERAKRIENRWLEQIYRLQLFLHDTPQWLMSSRERFRAAAFKTAPRAELSFAIDPDRPSQNTGTLHYQSSSFNCYNHPFDGIEIDVAVTGRMVRIEKALVQQGEKRLNLTGYYDSERNVCEVHVYHDMPPQALIPFLPKIWQKKIETMGLHLTGSMQAEGWIGPCKLEDVPASWGGWAIVEKAWLNEFPIERAFAAFKRNGNQFTLEDGLLKGGRGVGKGTLNLSIMTDFKQRITQGSIDLGLDLKQVESILPRGLRITADMFDVLEKPVAFNGTFYLPLDHKSALLITGAVSGTHGLFRGAPFSELKTSMSYSNLHLVLDPFMVACATGGIKGSLDLDLDKKLFNVDIDITTNPKTVAPMAGSNVVHYFEPFHFSEDNSIQVNGLIDAKDDLKTDLRVVFSGQNVGGKYLTFDHLSGEAHRIPGLLMISNIEGQVYQGSMTGKLDIIYQPTGTRFELDSYMHDLSLDAIVSDMNKQPTNRFEGRIFGKARLNGKYPDEPLWKNLRGKGNITIKDGRLMQIPLFGGLSSILSKIFPGLGFSEQNHLEAALDFGDGAVSTDNLSLSGSMISISGHGSYDWSDKVKLYVQVHPFRDGSIASIVRIVTMPISYILEYKATGSRKNPTWRPANLPL